VGWSAAAAALADGGLPDDQQRHDREDEREER